MNSKHIDRGMDSGSVSTTSSKVDKKRKSKVSKLNKDASLNEVLRPQKKSFWKNLFRFRNKNNQENISEDAHALPTQRLSSIFEETRSEENKTVGEDIEEIKNTLQRLSETSNTSTILTGLVGQCYENRESLEPTKEDQHQLGYLSDTSCSSDDETDDEEIEMLALQAQNLKIEGTEIPIKTATENEEIETVIDSPEPTIKEDTDELKESKENYASKDAYSFEYSEASDSSNEDFMEEKPEKVKFDEKVETKDADSIIAVRFLEENESKIEDDLLAKIQEIQELENNPFEDEEGYSSNPELPFFETNEDLIEEPLEPNSTLIKGKDYFIEHNNSTDTFKCHLSNPLETINPMNSIQEEELPLNFEDPVMESISSKTGEESPIYCNSKIPIPIAAIPIRRRHPLGNIGNVENDDEEKRLMEQTEPSCSGLSQTCNKPSTTQKNEDIENNPTKTTNHSESIEELELWSTDLNDFNGLPKAVYPPKEEFDDDNIDDEVYTRDFGLNKYFRMIQNCSHPVNIAVAYNPTFLNLSMLQNLDAHANARPSFGEEKNKVIRKRKMMSLLHDKHIVKEYLKELGHSSTSLINSTQQSENKKLKQQIIDMAVQNDQATTSSKMLPNNVIDSYFVPLNTPSRSNSSKSLSEKQIMVEVYPQEEISNENSESSLKEKLSNENTLFTLEKTKNKLEKFLETDNSKLKALYPTNYLQVYSLLTNKVDEDGIDVQQHVDSSDTLSESDIIHDNCKKEINKSESLPLESTNTEEITIKSSALAKHSISEELLSKILTYQSIDQDINGIIQELMTHVTDLKDTCVEHGVTKSVNSEPFLTLTKQIHCCEEVKDILDDLLEYVFKQVEENEQLKIEDSQKEIQGSFGNTSLSFVTECGQINEDVSSLNFKVSPTLKNLNTETNTISLTKNLEIAAGFLTSIYDEMCEFNPLPYNILMESQEVENEEDPAVQTENTNITTFGNDLTFENYPVITDFNTPATSLNISINNNISFETFDNKNIEDLSEKISYIKQDEITERINNKYFDDNKLEESKLDLSETDTTTPTEVAENIINYLENRVQAISNNPTVKNDTNNYYDDANKEKDLFNNMKYNRESSDLKELAKGLNQIFFGQNTNNITKKQELNYPCTSFTYEPQPGTSKQQTTFQKSSTTSNSHVHLPSVPSTELETIVMPNQNNVETLIIKKMSDLTNSSNEEINEKEVHALYALASYPSNIDEASKLERKSPETNLPDLFNLTVEDTKNWKKDEIDKCIETNLKLFDQNTKEAALLNNKTIEMLDVPVCLTPTPDGSITILSTISINMPKSFESVTENTTLNSDSFNTNLSISVDHLSKTDEVKETLEEIIINSIEQIELMHKKIELESQSTIEQPNFLTCTTETENIKEEKKENNNSNQNIAEDETPQVETPKVIIYERNDFQSTSIQNTQIISNISRNNENIELVENSSIPAETNQSIKFNTWYGNILDNKFKTNSELITTNLSKKYSEKIYKKSRSSLIENPDSKLKNIYKSDEENLITSNEKFSINNISSESIEEYCSSENIATQMINSDSNYEEKKSLNSIETEYLSCLNVAVIEQKENESGKSYYEDAEIEPKELKNEDPLIKANATEKLNNIKKFDICYDFKQFLNADFSSKYLTKKFNFGIKPATLISEELDRKAKLTFGQSHK